MYRTPSATAKYGVVFPSLSQTPSPANYYESVLLLAGELRAGEWMDSCDGFYLSCVDYGIPRVSYFSASADRALHRIDAICLRTGMRQVKPAQPLMPVSYVPNYGGTELAFRRYLCDYTQVGLDLMATDLEAAQRLCAVYRWQARPSGTDPRELLEGTVRCLSETYRTYSRKHRDEFWRSFSCVPPAKTPWDHMLVNQVLCFDEFVRAPLKTAQISALLASKGHTFTLSDQWTPCEQPAS